MKILFKHKGRSRLVKVSTLSVSNNAPYSVRFTIWGRVFERFTAETDFNKVVLAFTQDFIDLREWYAKDADIEPSAKAAVTSCFSSCGDFLNCYPVFPNPYTRIVRCIKKGYNVCDYFPPKLLQDISCDLITLDVEDMFEE